MARTTRFARMYAMMRIGPLQTGQISQKRVCQPTPPIA
jgi:hypothetical protein